jgi:hypothetical protein
VLSHCEQRTLLRWWKANSLRCGNSIFRSTHHSPHWKFRIKVSWCWEPVCPATGRNLWRLETRMVNRGELMLSRPAETTPEKISKSAKQVILAVGLSWLSFSVIFLSRKANVRV